MSEEDPRIALLRRFYDAGTRDDLGAGLDLVHPDIVVDWSRSHGIRTGVYRGRDEVLDFFGGFIEVWEEFEFIHEEFIPLGEKVIRVGGIRARGSGSGIEVSARSAQVCEFKDGLLARITLYQTKEEALAAVADEGE